MARPAFKRWWTRIVPEPAERSTYVLASSLALLLLFWQWRPIGGVVWQVEHPVVAAALYGLFAVGWLTVLVTTFLINHFDLFGLRQVWFYLRGEPYRPLGFVTPGPYRHVRHPLYVGWLFAFWATPTMTAAHLLFAIMTTAYILIAIQLEERDLVDIFGERYAQYRRSVPMLVPRVRVRSRRRRRSRGRDGLKKEGRRRRAMPNVRWTRASRARRGSPSRFFREAGTARESCAYTRTRARRHSGAALMDRLAPRFRVFAPDSYDAGKSPQWPSGPSHPTPGRGPLVEPVLTRAGSPLVLVGHSYGAQWR
jgi:protein-S-isoprenylcysteine O-methyltransferase Ste14